MDVRFLILSMVCVAGIAAARPGSVNGDPAWQAYMDAATLAENDGRLPDAERSLLEALEVAGQPGAARMNLALSVETLADFYLRHERGDEAESLYCRSVMLWEGILGPDQPRIGIPIHNLAVLYLSDCRVEEALPLIDRVGELWERTLGPDHPERTAAIRSQVNGLVACGRDDEAARLQGRLAD